MKKGKGKEKNAMVGQKAWGGGVKPQVVEPGDISVPR